MKDKYEFGAYYFTQHPYSPTNILLAKASRKHGIKYVYFFSSDCNVMVKWQDIKLAHRVYL